MAGHELNASTVSLFALAFRYCLLALSGLSPATLLYGAPQAVPLGSELAVNGYTTGNQRNPKIAMDESGNFVVVWDSENQDGSGRGVFGRRYDSSGTPQGTEFRVNTYTTGDQDYPSVASDSAGNFVVVWQSRGQDGSDYGIFGQRYDSSGTPQGGEFQVNESTPYEQDFPSIAMDSSGHFIVVWGGGTVFGRRFDASGTPIGGDFQVSAETKYLQDYPSIALSASGNFVVAWRSLAQDGSGFGVFSRRFDSAGVPLGGEFQVNTFTTDNQYRPVVAADSSGDFVVVWETYGQDGNSFAIFARRFDGLGLPRGNEFQVNTYTPYEQRYPGLATDASGNFLVVWTSFGELLGDKEGKVFGQRFDGSGRRVGSEFLVNAYTTNRQTRGAVALDGAGNFAVAWQSSQQDGSLYGVFARRGEFSGARALTVDVHGGGGTTGNLNGVLEPGETVTVEPSWKNTLTGTLEINGIATDFAGPGGPTYTLNDAIADYGSIAEGETSGCLGATGNCYQVGVSATRPATHWDALLTEALSTGMAKAWTIHVGLSFSDVPTTHPFYKKIETLLHGGITAGCNPTQYCPGDMVSRGQMAIFVAKATAGGAAFVPSAGKLGALSYNCTAGGTSLFTDVSPTDIYCKHAHYLASQNVTLGCSANQYCPADIVTRLQMAAFVAKGMVAPAGGAGVPLTYGPDPVTGLSYSCDYAAPNVHFTDISFIDPFCKHVHFLWAKGIVAGCSSTQYCPSDPVTRDQMAKFLVNAFNLQLYGP